MVEKLDMEKLQKLVYFINNVKMSGPQRERLNRFIIRGILHGEIETDKLAQDVPCEETSVSKFVVSAELFEDQEARQGWIQSAKLFGKYENRCAANGISPESSSVFGRALKDMGVEFKKKADGNYYRIDFEAIR